MNTARSLLLSLFLSALAGCADGAAGGVAPITSDPRDQALLLERVGDWRLPVSVSLDARTSRQIDAGSLVLSPDGTWELRLDARDLSASANDRVNPLRGGTYTATPGSPSTLTLVDGASGARSVGVIQADGNVEVPLDGLRYRFVTAR